VGGVIPRLNGVYETYTVPELVNKISKGVPAPLKADPKGPVPMVAMPAWSQRLDTAELIAVASYLMTLRPDKVEQSDW
jgi:mono/diheme cytochrome c family protein